MKTITKVIPPARKPVFVNAQAHKALPVLCEILAEEKGVSEVTFIDATSAAIIREAERALRRKERRLRLMAERSLA